LGASNEQTQSRGENEMENNPAAFIPSLDITDPVERELAFWVMDARSRRHWSLAQQIVLLEKWNASWDKAIEEED
jgi:hypothetical protein